MDHLLHRPGTGRFYCIGLNMEQISLTLTDEECDALIFAYVQSKMRPESRSQFDATYQTTGDIKEALWHSVINEMVNEALLEEITRSTAAKSEQPTKD